MNSLLFSHPFKKGFQVVLLLAILLFNFGAGVAYALPPSNDNFASATVVPGVPYQQLSISTIDATIQTGEPAVPNLCDGRMLAQGLHTVWYRFTPAATGLVSFDTVGSNYDTYIAVWTGTALNNLTFYACDDDNLSSLQSQLLTSFHAGTTYYIQVAAYAGTTTDPSNPADVTGGNLNFHVRFPNIDVYVPSTTLKGQYYLPGGTGERASYTGTNNGPVKLINVDTIPTIAAERVIYNVYGTQTSFSELMGLPESQLSTIYWFPWYNNVDLDTQLRFGNVSGSAATVHVYIGGVEMTGSPFSLGIGQSTRQSFTGINNGPVEILSNVNIVAAERVIYKVYNFPTSFTEMMGLPNGQLDTTYWLPWYNNVDLDTQLRFGNVTNNTATVHVKIGGVEMTGSPFTLTGGASTRVSFAGINNGPVQIISDQNIVAAERVIYKINGVPVSFSEMMALPNNKLDTTYVMPWYNNKTLDTQLRFGNVSGSTATVHVYVGGTEMICVAPCVSSPFTLGPGQSTRVSFPTIDNGPVQIVSDVNIVAAERVIYKVNNVNTSFSEMMGLPNSLLDTTYWLPWYNNVDLDTQLRFGMP